ncbi:hypothetical protein BABINDRAFT_10988 [Babjeviella inositovora NRRL Y-12698]|uniref:ribonuclease Z n=1 Tax=Babjeviella inositovora NRRL Y-12698 TaxID=984486 RepID=A0A1E3QY31_9ASCO|nr:uncharacterized protein BABINDRAFT_10988 [Babjeviella inositovora NRRL Y-12698]ODQ82579.1 hypothetical protein BABINDRAFT_10988 [Babjeviella inositovora NRRL Y-12698]
MAKISNEYPLSIPPDALSLSILKRAPLKPDARLLSTRTPSFRNPALFTPFVCSNKAHIQALNLLEISSDRPLGMYTLKTVRHPTSDIPSPLLVLITESNSHYFGKCAEGTQRSLNEKGIKPSRMKNFFMTGVLDWNAIGGLPGLLLTLGDSGKANLTINYGSKILNYIVATWRGFVYRQGVDISINAMNDGDVLVEKYFLVKQVHTFPNQASHLNTHTSPPLDTHNSTLTKVIAKMFPKEGLAGAISDPSSNIPYINTDLPEAANTTHASNYILQFHQTRGKFSVERATELNIPRGPLYAKLARGESIEVDGKVILPDQVLLSPRKFQRVLVLDVPSSAYLESTMQNPAWQAPINAESDDKVGLVYHFLGEDVDLVGNEAYFRFLSLFGENCQHIISHPRYCPNTLNFKTAALSLLKLRSLQKDFFQLPLHQNVPERELSQLGAKARALHAHQDVVVSPEGFTIDSTQVHRNETNWSDLYDSTVTPLGISVHDKAAVIDEARLDSDTGDVTDVKNEVQIITLGTGSALPSRTRNVISTLVRIPQPVSLPVTRDQLVYKSMLLDAGEHTLGSLIRNYGDDLPNYLAELQLIYLSHLHADHHLGIMSIIKRWFLACPEGFLYLVCPWSYEKFVKEWSYLEPAVDFQRIKYISCQDFFDMGGPSQRRSAEFVSIPFESLLDHTLKNLDTHIPLPNVTAIGELYQAFGLASIAMCKAIHCKWAYSITLHFKDPDFKLSYSGDTRPNIHFAKVGRGSDLLLHEATLEDALIEDALSKKHSTIAEAIYTAHLMQVKKLVLTHFSQRYPELPDLTATEKSFAYLRGYLNDPEFAANPKPIRRNNPRNIFSFDLGTLSPSLEGMDYLYAFDNMFIKYGRIHEQKAVADKLPLAFADEEEEIDGEGSFGEKPAEGNSRQKKMTKQEKQEKKLQKQREKTETMRRERQEKEWVKKRKVN